MLSCQESLDKYLVEASVSKGVMNQQSVNKREI